MQVLRGEVFESREMTGDEGRGGGTESPQPDSNWGCCIQVQQLHYLIQNEVFVKVLEVC